MNKGRLIGGGICLAVGVLLGVLTYTLPETQMVFMIGDTNVPIAPAIILSVLGIYLLATAGRGTPEAVQEKEPVVVDEEKAALNKRLETIAWGCFLIMLGGFALVPREIIAKGVWSIGVGVIMIGLNVARYFLKIKMSGFTVFLGVVSLISGVTELLGINTLEGGILLIVLGAYLLIKPRIDKQKLFGKAEES
jgi:hypothetical protein